MQRYTIFFIVVNALHVSGGLSAHHQRLYNCMCSLRYCHAFLLSTVGVFGLELWFQPKHPSGRQQESMTIPKAAHTVLEAPDDGRKNHLKRVER